MEQLHALKSFDDWFPVTCSILLIKSDRFYSCMSRVISHGYFVCYFTLFLIGDTCLPLFTFLAYMIPQQYKAFSGGELPLGFDGHEDECNFGLGFEPTIPVSARSNYDHVK